MSSPWRKTPYSSDVAREQGRRWSTWNVGRNEGQRSPREEEVEELRVLREVIMPTLKVFAKELQPFCDELCDAKGVPRRTIGVNEYPRPGLTLGEIGPKGFANPTPCLEVRYEDGAVVVSKASFDLKPLEGTRLKPIPSR